MTNYTDLQLLHLHVDLAQNSKLPRFMVPLDEFDPSYISYGKFRSFLRTLYKSSNPVSLCNDLVFNLPQHMSDDVKEFVRSWLLKQVPSLPSAPDDDSAFDSIIPSDIDIRQQLYPYLDYLTDIVKKSSLDTQMSTNITQNSSSNSD